MQAADLLDEVVGFNGTVFAPTNAAFEAALALLGVGAAPELTDALKAAIGAVLVGHSPALTRLAGEP